MRIIFLVYSAILLFFLIFIIQGQENHKYSVIFAVITIGFLLYVVNKYDKHIESFQKELTEKNNKINKLEELIRRELFNQLNEETMKNLSFYLVERCMYGNISYLPDNFLKFICDYDRNLVIFRKVILEKLDYLDGHLKKEREENGKQNEVTLSRRNNVDDLLNKLNESAPKLASINPPDVLYDQAKSESCLSFKGVAN